MGSFSDTFHEKCTLLCSVAESLFSRVSLHGCILGHARGRLLPRGSTHWRPRIQIPTSDRCQAEPRDPKPHFDDGFSSDWQFRCAHRGPVSQNWTKRPNSAVFVSSESKQSGWFWGGETRSQWLPDRGRGEGISGSRRLRECRSRELGYITTPQGTKLNGCAPEKRLNNRHDRLAAPSLHGRRGRSSPKTRKGIRQYRLTRVARPF
jgi:hypothetical protein